MMKKNQAIYFFFIVFFALLVFFRDPLIAYGMGAAVKRYKQDLGLQFASYTSSSGHLRFKNVTLTKFEGLDCEDLDIYPHLQLYPFRLFLHVSMQKPSCHLVSASDEGSSLASLAKVFFPHPLIVYDVNVEGGRVFPGKTDENPFGFAVHTEKGDGYAIKARLHSLDAPDTALVSCKVKPYGEALEASLEVDVEDASILNPLFGHWLCSSSFGMEPMQGTIHASLAITAKQTHLISGIAALHIDNLKAQGSKLELLLPKLDLAIDFEKSPKERPFMAGVGANLAFDGLTLENKGNNIALQGGCGKLVLEKNRDPVIFADGVIDYNKEKIPLTITSSAGLGEEKSFWLQADVAMSAGGVDAAAASFSLCRPMPHQLIAQLDVPHINNKVLALVSAFIPNWRGAVSCDDMAARLVGYYNMGHLEKLQWEGVEVKGLSVAIDEEAVALQLPHLSLTGLCFKQGGSWHLANLELFTKQATLSSKSRKIQELNAALLFHRGILEPSTVSFAWEGGAAHLHALGPKDNISVSADISSSWQSFFHLMFPGVIEMDPQAKVRAKIALDVHKDFIFPSGMIAIEDDSECTTTLDIQGRLPCTFDTKALLKGAQLRCESKDVPHLVYLPFLSLWDDQCSLYGPVSCDVKLRSGKLTASVESTDLFFQRSGFGLSTGPLAPGSLAVSYDIEENDLAIEGEFIDAFASEKSSGLSFSEIRGPFSYKHQQLKAEQLTMNWEGITLPLSLYYDHAGMSLHVGQMEASIDKLLCLPSLKEQWGHLFGSVHGRFKVSDGAVSLFLQRGQEDWLWHYKIGMQLQKLHADFSKNIGLSGLDCDISYDSSSRIFAIKNVHSNMRLGTKSYGVDLKDFSFNAKKDSPFFLDVKDGALSVLTLAGKVFSRGGLFIEFDSEATRLLSQPLIISSFAMTKALVLENIQGSIIFDDRTRKQTLHHLQVILGNQPWLTAAQKFSHDTSASINVGVNYSREGGLLAALETDSLVYKNYKANGCKVAACYQEGSLKLTDIKVGLFSGQAQLCLGKESLPYQLQLYHPEGKMAVMGTFDKKKRHLEVKNGQLQLAVDYSSKAKIHGNLQAFFQAAVDLDSSFSLKAVQAKLSGGLDGIHPDFFSLSMTRPSTITYEQGRGWSAKDIDMQLRQTAQPSATVFIESCTAQREFLGFDCTGCKALLTKEATTLIKSLLPASASIWDKRKDGTWKLHGDVRIDRDSFDARLQVNSGSYCFGAKDIELFDPKVQLTNKSLQVHSKVKLLATTLLCDVQKDFIDGAPIYMLLRSDSASEGLKVLFKERGKEYDPIRIEGSLFGCQANLQKSEHIRDGSYFGVVKIDFTSLAPFLPLAAKETIQALKLGSGFSMQGHFFMPESSQQGMKLKAEIKGENCEMLGYRFDSLSIKADATDSKVVLDDIKIEDRAVSIQLKRCNIDKDLISGRWILDIPLGHIKELRPSILSEGGVRGREKPFVLKNLSIYNFRGSLGDAKSFTGSGALHFVNSYKKEFSIFDIPREMIKDIGLDTGLLTPIAGEADFSFKKGRCIFHELKNSYSEGRRSQFFLSDHSQAYVDFAGNWHVDLRMKQHVLLKWSQSLLVSIRGTLSKPKYSLVNVEDIR